MSSLQRKQPPFLHLGTTSGGESITLTGQEFERFKWVQGVSGSGKSTFLAWIVLSLLRLGITTVLVDPHADLCRLVLNLLAQTDFFKSPKGFEHLHFIDFARPDRSPAFNVLRQEHIDNYKVAQNILEAIHRAFPSSSGTTAALDNTITYASFVLAENNQPLTQLQKFLLDKAFRDSLLVKIKDQQIIQFFDYKFSDKVNSQLIDSTMRRLDLLTFSPILRMSLGQRANMLSWQGLWDRNVSCLISLGGLTENEKRLLGCLLLVSIEQALLSRLNLPPEKRSKVALMVDEAPLFIAQDETSFTNILEQCRKAGATCTTFANQTLSQLSKGMLGSLQNALPIIMKAGTSNSSELASRFYRPSQQLQSSVFFGFNRSPGVFDNVQNITEARMIFEQLSRQEAIVMLPDRAVKIKTPTIPVKLQQKILSEIENIYAKRLLTPLSQIGKEAEASQLTLASSPVTLAKRRVPRLSPDLTPFQTFVGCPGNDEELQAIFSQYGYLTVPLLAKLLQKSENTARNKLKKLVDAGVLETQSVPRTTPSGKTPLVYSLAKKGVRKHEFLEHALASSAILLNAALLPTVASGLTILDIRSDLQLKTSPITLPDGNTLVPDGCVRLCSSTYEYVLYIEVDRNSESREKIVAKLNNYKLLASQCDCMAVAFCVVTGGDLRVKTLRNWAEVVIQEELRELFLYAPLDLASLTPDNLYLTPTFLPVGENMQQPLIVL